MARSPFDQIRALYARLGTGQKLRLGAALLLGALGVWGITALANRVRYEVLYSNLEPEDAASVIAKLKESKVDYRIEAGGSAVSVPTERVAEMRLQLAGEGIPRGAGVGFEIFDRSTFDLSDFVQNVNYQRAMERELGRTVEALDAVSKARVHLVLPARTLFAGDAGQEAKASVVVKLFRGRELRSGETLAIAHLVASAVQGLSPEKVSIVDTDGRMLKDGQGDDTVQSLTARQLEVKSTFEREMQSKLVALLTPIVGDGRVRARVNASLDFQKVERVEETYDSEHSVVRSEQKGKQKRSSGGGGGAPGTASNLPTGTPVASSTSNESDESSDSTVNYEIPKTVSTITEPVGDLKQLSVAVVVDNAPPKAGSATGAQEPQSVPRSEEEMKKLTELVRATVGFDDKRGDVLTVANLPFDVGPAEENRKALGSAERREFWFGVAKYPSLVLGALLLFFLVVRPLLGLFRGALTPLPGEAERSLLGSTQDAPVLALRQRLIEISAGEPEGAAHVVRAWIKEKN